MAITFLGVSDGNVLAQDFCTFSTDGFAGLEPAGLEASFLKTEEPSEIARLATLDPLHTRWFFDLSGVVKPFDSFAIDNHNLVSGSFVRFVVGTNSTGWPTIYSQAPNAVVASTNIVGAVTNVDEAVSSPDGFVIGPSDPTSSWSVRLAWPAMSVTPRLGIAMGQLVLSVKKIFVGSGAVAPITYPALTVRLYESGSLVEVLGSRAVTAEVGVNQVFIFPFDFSDLVDPTGGNIEFDIAGTRGRSTTDGSYAVLDAVSINCEDTNNTIATDSLFIEVPSSSTRTPKKSIHFTSNTPWVCSLGTIAILSDQADHSPFIIPSGVGAGSVPIGSIEDIPLTYIEAGVAVGGSKFELLTGIQSEGPQINVEIEEVTGNTLGGQTYGADSFRRRVCEPTTIAVNRAEKDFLMNDLAWQRGHSGAFYVILETGVALERQLFTSFWATLKSLSTPRQISRWDPEDEVKYTMTIAFEEKL